MIYTSFSTLGRRSVKTSGRISSSPKVRVGKATLTLKNPRHDYYHSLWVRVGLGLRAETFFIFARGNFQTIFTRLTLTTLTQIRKHRRGVFLDGLGLGLGLVRVTPTLTFGVMGQIPDTACLRGIFDGVTRSAVFVDTAILGVKNEKSEPVYDCVSAINFHSFLAHRKGV